MLAVIQISIALGPTLGGVLFDNHGYQNHFIATAILLVASAGVALFTARVRQAAVV